MTLNEVWQITAAVLAALGGGGAIVFALSSFLGKVWANRILEHDRVKYQTELERLKNQMEQASQKLQGDIEKTLVVHRMHFEAEFRALSEVWKQLSELRTALSAFSSLGDLPEPTRDDLREKLLAAVSRAVRVVDEHRPFLTEDVHTHVMRALHGVSEEQLKVVLDSTNTVVVLIRDRLRALSVYPG
jgi:hypothetical protein